VRRCIDIICTLPLSSLTVANGSVCSCRRRSGSKHAAVKPPATAGSVHPASGAIRHACVGEMLGDLLTSDGADAAAASCTFMHSNIRL